MTYRIRIPREIVIGRRTAAIAAAGLLSVGLAVLVSSETITLETFYPSPAGVYKNLTTLSATVLARDAERVGIGTTNPQAKLEVQGGIKIGNDPNDCTAAKEGTLRFNSGKIQLCRNSAWDDIGAGLKVLSGHDVAPGECTGVFDGGLCNGKFYTKINFPQPFSAPPHVIVTAETVSEQGGCVGGATDKVIAHPENITATSFLLYANGSPAGTCGEKEGWASRAKAGWIAIGY